MIGRTWLLIISTFFRSLVLKWSLPSLVSPWRMVFTTLLKYLTWASAVEIMLFMAAAISFLSISVSTLFILSSMVLSWARVIDVVTALSELIWRKSLNVFLNALILDSRNLFLFIEEREYNVKSLSFKREVSNPLSMSVIARSRIFLITLFKSCLWVDKADLSQFTIPERSCRTRPRKEVGSTGACAVPVCISLARIFPRISLLTALSSSAPSYTLPYVL